MKLVHHDAAGFHLAADAIRSGEIVAHPTETVYGLAVDPFSVEALQRLWQVKSRDAVNPVLIIVGDDAQLERVVTEVSARARRYMDHFWPGPLTLLLPKATTLPTELTAGYAKVAVRCPGHPLARRICIEAGMPLTSTSANRSGFPPATMPTEIGLDGVALCIDGGSLPPRPPSTIYDPDEDCVIRLGAIVLEELHAF